MDCRMCLHLDSSRSRVWQSYDETGLHISKTTRDMLPCGSPTACRYIVEPVMPHSPCFCDVTIADAGANVSHRVVFVSFTVSLELKPDFLHPLRSVFSGNIFCGDCSSKTWRMPQIDKAPVRVCDTCHDELSTENPYDRETVSVGYFFIGFVITIPPMSQMLNWLQMLMVV